MSELIGESLVHRYAGHTVLHGVDVALSPGKVVGLLGPSGSGKTTLLWLLAGLYQPHAGRVFIRRRTDGGEVIEQSLGERRPALGMVFQQPALWDHLTVAQHLHLVLSGQRLDRQERRRRVAEMLAGMKLEALARRRPGQLSGGERQRVAIARALVVAPQWLLLDEPLAHLDGASRDELFDLLRQMLADSAAGVIIASHQATEMLRIADELIVLQQGRVVQAGSCAEVYHRPVSFAAARALAPAWQLAGVARDGVLYEGVVAILADIERALHGSQNLILRPGDVRFEVDTAGPAAVVGCEFAADTYHLRIEVAGQRVVAASDAAIAVSTCGRLRLSRRR